MTRVEVADAMLETCSPSTRPGSRAPGGSRRLAGQREDYLVKALREYKSNTRRGYAAAMAEVLYAISDEQILDLAYFLARVQ